MQKYKKYIVALMVLGLMVFGATKVSATTLDDLQTQIKILSEQVASLSVQLKGQIIEATTNKTVVPSDDATITQKNLYNFTKIISLGSKDPSVLELQNILITYGLLSKENNTGYFGQLTRSALMAYQEKNLITKTGIVDLATIDKLNKDKYNIATVSNYFDKSLNSNMKISKITLPSDPINPNQNRVGGTTTYTCSTSCSSSTGSTCVATGCELSTQPLVGCTTCGCSGWACGKCTCTHTKTVTSSPSKD